LDQSIDRRRRCGCRRAFQVQRAAINRRAIKNDPPVQRQWRVVGHRHTIDAALRLLRAICAPLIVHSRHTAAPRRLIGASTVDAPIRVLLLCQRPAMAQKPFADAGMHFSQTGIEGPLPDDPP
jgi:predicted RNA polymerase sigma factor